MNSPDIGVMIGAPGAAGVKADVEQAVNYIEEPRAPVLAGPVD